MAIYKENIVDIDLSSGNIHRSFLSHSIGKSDNAADRFGIRVFRNGEPVNLEGVSVQGFFRDPQGNNIAITSGNVITGNLAEVILPQACYNYDGQFTLAIKLIGNSVTGTMRIVDGVVNNTNTSGAVAPTETVPTYQEIIAVYEQMLAAKEGSVRFDITQNLTSAQKEKARGNIGAVSQADLQEIENDIDAIENNIQENEAEFEKVSDYLEDAAIESELYDGERENGKAWNTYSEDWYTTNGEYVLFTTEEVYGYIKIVSAWTYVNLPGVVYFKGQPSSANYIGKDAYTDSGNIEEITNYVCNIPKGCTYILVQTGYLNYGSLVFETGVPATEKLKNGVYQIRSIKEGLMHTHFVWSTIAQDWYPSEAYDTIIIPAEMSNNYLKIVRSYNSSICPAVIYFSDYPSGLTFIGREGQGQTGDAVSLIENHECTIPVNCKYIILQSYIENGYDYIFQYTESAIDSAKKFKKPSISITSGKAWNTMTKDWYVSNSMGYDIIDIGDINGLLWVKTAITNSTTPAVCYFSGEPDEDTYLGCEGKGASTEKTRCGGILCIIPDNTQYIVLQGFIDEEYPSFQIFSANEKKTNQYIDMPIQYAVLSNGVEIKTLYGSETLTAVISKTGPNNLPDFSSFSAPVAYSHMTDFFGPFIVKAKENGDGDDPTSHNFTGGNHAYDNSGSGAATAECTKFKCYADGKELNNGDDGECSLLRIEWVNRIKAYNTRKSDGTGRAVLEERHTVVFNGYEYECITTIVALEDITIETWYGYQAYISTNYPNVTFIGGTNRTMNVYSDSPQSGNATPDMAVCTGLNGQLEIEVDRSYDIGKGTMYNGEKGMFCSGSKVYTWFIQNHDLDNGEHYAVRGWYRFKPIVEN